MSGTIPNKFAIPPSKEMNEVNRQKIPKTVNSVVEKSNSAKKVESKDPIQPIQSSSRLSIDNFSAIESSSSVKPVNGDRKISDSSESNFISDDVQANEGVATTTVSKVPVSFPTLAKLGNTNSVIVNPRQRGNPILKHIRNIPWEYGNIIPDYVMGHATCALFLSLRYHQLHPSYVHDRLKTLGRSFDLRVLLVQVDLADPHYLLKNLSKICILANCTLILAFTAEEAGRYLETYKIYENKSPEPIMEKTDGNFMTKLTDCFTTIKSVNKTDCTTLISSFKTIKNIIQADKEDLGLCPGFGPQKAKRLSDVVHEPFVRIRKQPY